MSKTGKEKEELAQKSFLRAASSMFGVDPTDTSHLLRVPIEYTIVGESLNGVEKREYVVPVACICEECHKMFAEGADTKMVAEFIRRFLKVIYVTQEEKLRLEEEMPLGLFRRLFFSPGILARTMPPGWNFKSGDVFARLHYANIQFKLYEDK